MVENGRRVKLTVFILPLLNKLKDVLNISESTFYMKVLFVSSWDIFIYKLSTRPK